MTYSLTKAELGKLKRAVHWLRGFAEGSGYVGVINRASDIEDVIQEVEKRGDVPGQESSKNE